MKSICIKTNNENVLKFINDELLKLDLDSVCMTNHKFKLYKNVIIHYTRENLDFFYDKVASILTEVVIEFYEKKLLKRILEYNYFYFNSAEKKEITQLAKDFIEEDDVSQETNYFAMYSAILEYITENKSIVFDGFVNFRLTNYMKNLDYIIDLTVNKYITDKEYLEFVNMLKLYVSLTPPKMPLVHMIYLGTESILLDKDRNIIPLSDENLNSRYLSDISFSSNDYALNTLLNITPRKLVIHLMNGKSDEFVDTLKLIFENRCEICDSCDVCRLYRFNFN